MLPKHNNQRTECRRWCETVISKGPKATELLKCVLAELVAMMKRVITICLLMRSFVLFCQQKWFYKWAGLTISGYKITHRGFGVKCIISHLFLAGPCGPASRNDQSRCHRLFFFFPFDLVIGKQKKHSWLTTPRKAKTRVDITVDPAMFTTEKLPHKQGELFPQSAGMVCIRD